MIDFRQTLLAFCRHKVEFIIVGGVAAVLNGAAYMTFDLDIVHHRSPENLVRLMSLLTELDARYRVRPELKPQPTHLASDGHQLLLTKYGPLDVLGAIEHGLTYEDLLPKTRTVTIAPDCNVAVLGIPALIELKEGSKDPKHQQQLAVLKKTLRQS